MLERIAYEQYPVVDQIAILDYLVACSDCLSRPDRPPLFLPQPLPKFEHEVESGYCKNASDEWRMVIGRTMHIFRHALKEDPSVLNLEDSIAFFSKSLFKNSPPHPEIPWELFIGAIDFAVSNDTSVSFRITTADSDPEERVPAGDSMRCDENIPKGQACLDVIFSHEFVSYATSTAKVFASMKPVEGWSGNYEYDGGRMVNTRQWNYGAARFTRD